LAVQLSQQNAQNHFTEHNEMIISNDKLDLSATDVLLHELQLGEQLNESVVQTRRADFSLMLAMLTEDVREQSQFILPKTDQPTDSDTSNSALRKEFNLPPKASLGLSSTDDIVQFNQAKSIQDNNVADIRLTNALRKKPLAFRDNRLHIETEVLQNTSLLCQLKHQQQVISTSEDSIAKLKDKPVNQPLNFNAKAWLDSIQQSLVNAPLLN
jgi:hypothetical protein